MVQVFLGKLFRPWSRLGDDFLDHFFWPVADC